MFTTIRTFLTTKKDFLIRMWGWYLYFKRRDIVRLDVVVDRFYPSSLSFTMYFVEIPRYEQARLIKSTTAHSFDQDDFLKIVPTSTAVIKRKYDEVRTIGAELMINTLRSYLQACWLLATYIKDKAPDR
jgi:hypothetical protein